MEYIVISGDTCTFDSTTTGVAIVTLAPSTITGSGQANVGGKKVCVVGDESKVQATGTYVNAAFANGTCKAEISELDTSQKATKVSSNGKKVILATGKFKVKITVVTPALNPSGTADTSKSFSGTGSFVTTNTKVQAA